MTMGLAPHPRPARTLRRLATAVLALACGAAPLRAQRLLVPMDDAQTDHLKAYGLTYGAMTNGLTAEWLLNFRGGSFLLPDVPALRRQAALAGVSVEPMGEAALAAVRREMAAGNMEGVPLEKAPRIAVYSPPGAQPWDDAVTLALRYAGIQFTAVYDEQVERGDLTKYDWLHLHHEDFTGQFNKFHLGYRDTPWFRDMVATNAAMATSLGYPSVPALKKAVAERIRGFVERGGFLFAMCGATETLELAIAARDVDIAGEFADGTPMDPDADARMLWGRTMAFRDVHLERSPFVNAMSDIDGHQVNVPARRQPLGTFTLFNFSAKFDPVPSMLVQDHRAVINDYYGVTTSFNKSTLKPADVVLATEEGAPWVKYIHGDYGKGTWTYLGGHDPEDPQHAVGNPPTDLSLHKSSPGYRLILNNVLFPAARKKPRKT